MALENKNNGSSEAVKTVKKVGVIGMGITFAGSILGAGYVSGQELFQYFGCYGSEGIAGLVISLILITGYSILAMYLAGRCNTATFDDVVVRFNIKWVKSLFGIVFSAIYYMITIVMISGIASLAEQLLGISRLPVAVIITIIVMVIVYFGVDGMLAVFTFSVPVLVVAAIVICLIQIVGSGLDAVQFTGAETNPLLGGWLFSAVNYATCNGFASIGVLTPLEGRFKGKTVKYWGLVLGGAILLTIALAILSALATYPEAVNTDLPMLSVAQNIGIAAGYIYGVLLFLAMFGNAVATFVAVMNYMELRMRIVREHKLITIVILGIAACFAGMVGFSKLVGLVYPIIGYIGIIAALLMIEHVIHLKKNDVSFGGA